MAAPNNTLRLLFAGTPEFAATHLQALLQSPHEVVAVYTQPDRPAGRGKRLASSAVKQLAQSAGLTVAQPATLRSQSALQDLNSYRADLLIVVAYGLILPQQILDSPRYGCLNVHASLLPRWRGAAPIQRALEAGDTESGITIMQMDAGLDTGAMLVSARTPIGLETTAAELEAQLSLLGPELLLEVLDNIHTYRARAQLQDNELATYAHKITKLEARLDWQLPASVLSRKVRAFNPFPVAWTEYRGDRIRVWEALESTASGKPGAIISADERGIVIGCSEHSLSLQVAQLEGGKPLTVRQLLHSRREQFTPGNVLGD